jgi:peptidoglycan/xylan/chitin deacetylase (PgdA/CDA1 family)
MTTRLEIATLGYHDVTDDPFVSGFQRSGALPFKHTVAGFARDLDAIAAAPIAPRLVTDIDLSAPGRHLLLTFDDGGKSALHISDALCARGWRGHFFIVTNLLGARTFLTPADVRQLRSSGHLIGSHSHTHPDIFKALSPRRMLEEWHASTDALSQALGERCATAAVPGGDISPRVLESAAAAGLRALFTSEPWCTPRRVHGCWMLGRYIVKAATPSARIAALAAFRGWRTALLVRRFKVAARTALPSLYRAYVARTTREWDAVAERP